MEKRKILKAKVVIDKFKSDWCINNATLKKFDGKTVRIYEEGRIFDGVKAYKMVEDNEVWNWPEYFFKFQSVQYELDFGNK